MKKIQNPESRESLSYVFQKKRRGRKSSGNIPKGLVLPSRLHALVGELAFRENLTRRDFIEIALNSCLRTTNDNQADYNLANKESPLLYYGEQVTTTMRLSAGLIEKIRSLSHYCRIAEKKIIADAIASFALELCNEKYLDLIKVVEKQDCREV